MMKLSGHKKYDTFKKNVRLSLDEYADDIAKGASTLPHPKPLPQGGALVGLRPP